ncbi:MAG: hypothetical protein GVY25_01955 [Bacteroidetes bacterium]|jgi:hypothetical protein|nr:hypothetical protein [Bacteroidota bacterium]
MPLLFFTILGPIIVFLLLWVAATAYRIYFPEQPLPFERDPVVLREKARRAGQSVPVGIREIRADQRRQKRKDAQVLSPDYHYSWGGSDGFPDAWREDLWRRRN